MKQAGDQLRVELNSPHLAAFLRSGGTLEVGENDPLGAFARIRDGNRTVVVGARYRNFSAILKAMNSKARAWEWMPDEFETQEANK